MQDTRCKIYLDAQLGILRRAISRILTLTSERGVIVLFARSYCQDRFDRVERAILVGQVLGLDAFVQYGAQTVDPSYL